MAGTNTASNIKFMRANLVEAVRLFQDTIKDPCWRKMIVGKVISSKQIYEEAAMASGIPLPGVTSEYGLVPQSVMKQVAFQTWTPVKTAQQVRISREAKSDDHYNLMSAPGKLLAHTSNVADEIAGAVFLELSASATGLPLWDGKAYGATDHPLDSGTYSNVNTNTMSIVNLETMVQNMKGRKAHMGYPDPHFGPYQLECTETKEMLARRLTGADNYPTTNDNDPNVVRRAIMEVVVNPYAGSNKAYHAIHSRNPMENKRFMIDREAVSVTDLVYDGDTDSYKITAVRRRIFGVFDARDTEFAQATA